MSEHRLFPEGTVPEYTTAQWYVDRQAAPHLEQPGHRERLLVTAADVRLLGQLFGVRQVVDLGCGDGGLLTLLQQEFECWGYDLCPANVEAAQKRGVHVELLDVIQEKPRWAPLAVCTEMLEHLLDPHGFLRRLAEHSKLLVASSPWNEEPGQAYEYHAWAWDPPGYRKLLEQAGYQVLRQRLIGRFQVLAAGLP